KELEQQVSQSYPSSYHYVQRILELSKIKLDIEDTSMDRILLTGYEPKQDEVLSYLMYPQVFLDYQKAYNQFGDVTLLDTPTFFQ
ncbi:hypothetical protein, partial [Enterococcus faecium]|uniref:hypothetical protein n=1 Tax=Enterococcus faecium TaxID=1352 RepID=UPI00292CE07B